MQLETSSALIAIICPGQSDMCLQVQRGLWEWPATPGWSGEGDGVTADVGCETPAAPCMQRQILGTYSSGLQ